MRRFLISGLVLFGLTFGARAADSTVSALTAASALGGTELLYCVQGGADRKCTPVQIGTYVAPGTGALTALGVNVGTAGAFVVNGGALGTPTSGVATNLTGTAAGLTAGNVTTNANLTGDVTSVGNAATLAASISGAKTFSTSLAIGAGSAITSSGAGGALGTNAFTSTAYLPLSGGTLTGNLTISGAGFLTSGNVSTAAWTTNGVRTQMAAASYTDTTSSGTVANAYTDLFGVGTILASSATTYTSYYGAFFKAPVASTNVTMTNKSALGADTVSIGGQAQSTFALAVSGTTNLNGAVTATSINGNTFTTGTYTLTGTAGKTLTFSNSITLAGTDTTTMTFPTTSATIARTDAAQTFTGSNTFSNALIYGGVTLANSVTGTGSMALSISPTFTGTVNAAAITASGNVVAGAATLFTWNGRGQLSSPTTGSVQHGGIDVDTGPVAQTIRSQGALAGGTSNVAGANFTFLASPGKGTGAGGSFIFQTTPAGSTGTVVGTATTALTIDSTQSAIFAGTTDASASSGSGAMQIAGGASVAKRFWLPAITASSGLQTAVLCQSSSGEVIADSVACLASSERFKQDIAPSDLGLAAVMAMKPIIYRYAPTGNVRFDEAPNQRDIHAGFRAEDLAKIDRRFVAFDSNGVVRTTRQESIEASLVKAIQEQQAKIDALERRVR